MKTHRHTVDPKADSRVRDYARFLARLIHLDLGLDDSERKSAQKKSQDSSENLEGMAGKSDSDSLREDEDGHA